MVEKEWWSIHITITGQRTVLQTSSEFLTDASLVIITVVDRVPRQIWHELTLIVELVVLGPESCSISSTKGSKRRVLLLAATIGVEGVICIVSDETLCHVFEDFFEYRLKLKMLIT